MLHALHFLQRRRVRFRFPPPPLELLSAHLQRRRVRFRFPPPPLELLSAHRRRVRFRFPPPPLELLSAHHPVSRAVHSFETPYFKGSMIACAAGVGDMKDCGLGAPNATMRVLIQGQFLHPWRLGEVLSGQVFSRPLQHLPPRWIVSLGIKVVKTLTDLIEEDICSETEPYFLSPLVCLADKISVVE
ncbi:uncharacterized protein EMH_0093870 [Eimeria mitis]|uniref:Domain of unknown function at the cortex 1 domain-containing protein n=1 Tax=Eimeria mitis TaxID=44415 RepID=U6KDS8_9EIME|nr:uncharacterized protein EMH_0093870 [Eimeria mitis]CDJ34926.1 hypothetical protein, conserved [Eimeria mitis]